MAAPFIALPRANPGCPGCPGRHHVSPFGTDLERQETETRGIRLPHAVALRERVITIVQELLERNLYPSLTRVSAALSPDEKILAHYSGLLPSKTQLRGWAPW
jgi:hypothetical protein